ncbi:class I SAM-dependent methyltransferase [Reichenbachiella carrageenanivorans]|uniref:Class I SAM-dependent methyltransferase n=1 Tax=Reichenbachiella carrageenanivorans TaxID=2979869 RepID=A0ABY6D7Q7_9BACT|nr:class I SAM-dependent methyltransferase [Reichenbachiella carrageenanivorans]UXX81103.1 class I SAM-dependent methyltransferase [Reichenbachiella carrageenanivorans]
MKEEKDSTYYDELFESRANYKKTYKESYYWVHWTQVIKFLGKDKNQKILEIGCGTGQLTEYLLDETFKNYVGFDFSTKAIEIAKKQLPDSTFFEGDALAKSSYDIEYDTVICLEVLEHVTRDLDIIQNIETGKTIIFSVPNFWDPSHVRIFNSERAIKKRYFTLIDIQAIVRVGNIYIAKGTRSDFKPNLLQSFLKSRETVNVSSFIKRIKHRLDKL